MNISATLAGNELLARRRAAGESVLSLAFGEAGLPVHPTVVTWLTDGAHRNDYGPVAGSLELRSAVAGYWGRRGLPTDPDTVVAGPGSKPLLYALMLAVGGDVVVPNPSWVSYAAQARLFGGHPIYVPTLPDQGGVPDPDLMADAIRSARRAGRDPRSVVVTVPDNPTGTVADPDTLRRLTDVARNENLVIIDDQIYRDLVHDPCRPVPTAADTAPERTVVTTGLSKNLALGGWRIGVARLPAGTALRDRLLGIGSEIWSTPSQPIQHAAARAFAEPPEVVERVAASRRLHTAVARAVHDVFVAAGVPGAAPQAAFYLYPDFEPWRDRLADRWGVTTSDQLAELLLDRFGVGVLPGAAFGEPEHALRLRVATSLLYGAHDDERRTALTHADPVSLPWIAGALDRLRGVLDTVGGR